VVHKGERTPLIDFNIAAVLIAQDAIAIAKETPNIMSDLVEKTIEAKQTMLEAVEGIGHNMDLIKPMKKEIIEELRGLRMVTTTEVAAMLKPLEELRKFFLGDDHQKEIDRLKEFVDLCERLEKLKKSGFLDTVADTMIKLS
jgi:hypothetical protein